MPHLFVIAYAGVSDFRKDYLKRAKTEPLIYDLCFHKWICQEKCSQKIPKIMDRQDSGGMMSQPG